MICIRTVGTFLFLERRGGTHVKMRALLEKRMGCARVAIQKKEMTVYEIVGL